MRMFNTLSVVILMRHMLMTLSLKTPRDLQSKYIPQMAIRASLFGLNTNDS